jgi:catechol 2,3-dioxygenase-like lactoylglutathione lyase family enzyme
MIRSIDTMVKMFESGKLSRRELVLSLASLATMAVAAQATEDKDKATRAVTINHVTVKVPDLQRTTKFYQEFFGMPLKQHSATTHILGVGDGCFFGIEQGDTKQPGNVNHFDFGIKDFNADDFRAKLTKHNLKYESGNSQESFKFTDPDGFLVQVNGPDYVGHVGS